MAKIADKLDNINKTLEKMLDVMGKQEPRFIKVLMVCGLFVALFSIIDHVDIIIRWIKEGIW